MNTIVSLIVHLFSMCYIVHLAISVVQSVEPDCRCWTLLLLLWCILHKLHPEEHLTVRYSEEQKEF